MKRLLASLRTGAVTFASGPAPRAPEGGALIQVTRSLVSAGTERMMVEFGRASLLEKARAQPDKVAQTLAKLRTDGPAATLDAVRAKLNAPVALGYSAVGRVIEVGSGAPGLAVGDRVVTNQPHAEFVAAMATTIARVPDGVPDDAAAFTVVGAVALHGIRLIAPTLGESVAVIGLGLIGLLAAQLLHAAGARVIGIDPDPARRALAEGFGIATTADADPAPAATTFARAGGVDAVLITAATRSRALIGQAAAMCRARGRIVLTGVAPLNLSRDDFFRKELTFQVSAAYGPGRYDPAYEARGHDYPLAHVRWTMRRNFEAVLDMLTGGRIATQPLISHRFPFDRAPDAFALLTGGEPSLGVLLDYPQTATPAHTLHRTAPVATAVGTGVSVIGSGDYAARTLLPALAAAGAQFRVLVDNGGPQGPALAARHRFATHSIDPAAAFGDAATSTIVIATRHDSHADLAVRALNAGKHVFVEKPLALTADDIDRVEAAHAASGRVLTVGFNRRFSPHIIALKAALARAAAPPAMVMTVNALALPHGHWASDPSTGGGRIAGEACHFIDLLRHLAGAPIISVTVDRLRPGEDTATIGLAFASGAIGTIHYFANGHAGLPKEQLELFTSGRVYTLDNFRRTRAYGDPAFRPVTTARPDKGHAALATTVFAATRGERPPPIPADEVYEVARATVLAAELARG